MGFISKRYKWHKIAETAADLNIASGKIIRLEIAGKARLELVQHAPQDLLRELGMGRFRREDGRRLHEVGEDRDVERVRNAHAL